MKLFPSIACAIAACGLLLSPAAPAQSPEGNGGRMHQYEDDVSLSTGQIRAGDVCVNFIPILQSLDFFNGLERIDTQEGSEYRKDSRVVEYFPDYLTIEVNIRVEECDSNIYTPAKTPDVIKGMQFRVQWKRGLYLRPVAHLTIERKPIQMEEGDNRMLFVIRVRDHNVPLSDHLILSVLSAQGKIMSRMSARL
ncbi:MAG: hypothetical protein WA192_15455 [Candidatus Acidiferrales bacterium]